MERRKFTREFKLEAVRLIKERGVSYVQASPLSTASTSAIHYWNSCQYRNREITDAAS
jgi:transposase-like protein